GQGQRRRERSSEAGVLGGLSLAGEQDRHVDGLRPLQGQAEGRQAVHHARQQDGGRRVLRVPRRGGLQQGAAQGTRGEQSQGEPSTTGTQHVREAWRISNNNNNNNNNNNAPFKAAGA
ncbi:unnamed protein product, partial [Ectocarpus sp. 13 AM-2016]